MGNPGGNNNPFANPDQAPVFVLDHFILDQITGNPGAIPRDYAIVAIEQFDPASGLYNNQIILEPVTQNGTMGASSFQLTFDSSDSILLDPAIHNDPALLVSQFQLQQPLGFLDLFNYIAPDPNLGNPGGNNNPFANPDQAPVFVLDHFMLDQITGNPGAIPRDYAIVAIEQFDPASGLYNNQIILEPVTQNGTMGASSFQLTFDSSDSILLDPAIHNDPALLVSQFQLQQPLGFLDLFNYIAPDPNLGNPGGNNNPFANPDQAPVFVLDHFMLDQITGNPGAIPRDYAIVAIEQFDPASGLYNNQIILEPVTQNGTMGASSFQLTFDSSDSILLDPAIHNDPALLVSQFQLQQPLGFLDLFNYIAPDPNLGNPGGNNNPFANPDQAPVFVLDHFILDQITGNPGAIPRDYAIVAIEQFDPASGLYNNQIILEPVTQNGTMGASSFQLTFDSSDSILLDPAIHNDPALLVSQFQLQQPLGFLDLFNYIAPDPNLGNPGGNNNPFANPDQAPVFVLDHFMLDQITGNPGAIPRDYAIVAIEQFDPASGLYNNQIILEPVTQNGTMGASSFQLTFDSSDSILLDPAIHNDPALLVSQFQLQQPLGFLDLFNYIAPDPNLGEEQINPPIVRTLEQHDHIYSGIVNLSAELLSDGNKPILERGFLISESLRFDFHERIPSFYHDPVNPIFEAQPHHLIPGKTYYFKAYATNEAGESFGSIKKIKIPNLYDYNNPWEAIPPMDGGWRESFWFGAYLLMENDWMYHSELGWIYTQPDSFGGHWVWKESYGWLWTQEGTWPFLYSHESGSWLYFIKSFDGSPIFFNYENHGYDHVRF